MAVPRRLVFLSCMLTSVIAALGDDAAGETVTYTYDELGRVKTATYSNGQTITYTYDAAGNRTVLQQTAVGAPSGSFSASPASI
ncbi:MAG: RHS repeat domain-containing protein, partial [Caulobacteraceae bacterium]